MEFEILPINNPERMFEFKYATKRKLFILRPSRGKGNHSDLSTPCQSIMITIQNMEGMFLFKDTPWIGSVSDLIPFVVRIHCFRLSSPCVYNTLFQIELPPSL